jgi:hypothetical protein
VESGGVNKPLLGRSEKGGGGGGRKVDVAEAVGVDCGVVLWMVWRNGLNISGK